MEFLSSEERAGLSDEVLELAVWRAVLKHLLGVRTFEAVERAVFDELRTQQ